MSNPLFYGTVRKSPECFILNLTLSLLFIGVASGVRLHPHLEDEEWYLILSFGKWWIPHLRIVIDPLARFCEYGYILRYLQRHILRKIKTPADFFVPYPLMLIAFFVALDQAARKRLFRKQHDCAMFFNKPPVLLPQPVQWQLFIPSAGRYAVRKIAEYHVNTLIR